MGREMDECPFCGGPIEADADHCPHCGSDDETGWNPDAEYESLELPEEDEEELEEEPERRPDPEDVGAQFAKLLGPALVAASWMAFVVIGSMVYPSPWLVLLPAVYLAACILALSRLAPGEKRRVARPR